MKLECRYLTRKRHKTKWLFLIHYPKGKHHIFMTLETERQALNRAKSICFNTSDKIAYLNIYEIWPLNNGEEITRPYRELSYRMKERNLLYL